MKRMWYKQLLVDVYDVKIMVKFWKIASRATGSFNPLLCLASEVGEKDTTAAGFLMGKKPQKTEKSVPR